MDEFITNQITGEVVPYDEAFANKIAGVFIPYDETGLDLITASDPNWYCTRVIDSKKANFIMDLVRAYHPYVHVANMRVPKGRNCRLFFHWFIPGIDRNGKHCMGDLTAMPA